MILREIHGGHVMSTTFNFYKNSNGTPIFEINYGDEVYYLMPFRKVKFQVCMSDDGVGAAGDSENGYFADVKNSMSIGVAHSDYWVKDFPVETVRKMIVSFARDAMFDHMHCSYGSKHIDCAKEIINELYGFDRNSSWHKFITECYKHFGVNTEWDD